MLIGLCVVCATVFIITAIASFPSRDIIRLKAEKWYYVSFYSPTEIVEAELNAQSLKETGGAGYIINDGTFRVTAFVYDSSSDAKTVADKQTLAATVYTVALPEVKIDAVKDEKTSKQVKEGFFRSRQSIRRHSFRAQRLRQGTDYRKRHAARHSFSKKLNNFRTRTPAGYI